MVGNGRKIARGAAFTILGILGIVGFYLFLLRHPGLFFSYHFSRGGITLFSDEPIPAQPAARILDDVERRLAGCPLATGARIKNLRVYVCNRRWRFVLFANSRYRVGGLTYPPLSDNIFLRSVHFPTNRLVGYSGREVPGERTLSYFIAHEIMHVVISRELGAARYCRLPEWKNEGYSDLVAKGRDFDFELAREQLRNGDPELDPHRSGLYLRHHLFVAYFLDHKGISVDELLRRDFDPTKIEAEILASGGRASPGVVPR